MPESYSDLNHYNLNPEFLMQEARKVIKYLGWDIQQENRRNINALIRADNGTIHSRISVILHRECIALNFESETGQAMQYHAESQSCVEKFIHTLDKHLETISPDLHPEDKEFIGKKK
jgi:hypothetical protein